MEDWSTKRVVQPESVLARELEGESVLLNLDNESYYGLDDVGTRMWQVLVAEGSVVAACEMLQAEYDVEPERLREDMLELIGQLRANGLLIIEDA